MYMPASEGNHLYSIQDHSVYANHVSTSKSTCLLLSVRNEVANKNTLDKGPRGWTTDIAMLNYDCILGGIFSYLALVS